MLKLKSGFTTGTAAAAAAKAALMRIITGTAPATVDVRLLTHDPLQVLVHTCHLSTPFKATATVIKDAGDDPDITHGATIGATVTLADRSTDFSHFQETGEYPNEPRVIITAGKGVGQVTLPGLEIPPGNPAINPGPRKMIEQAIYDVLGKTTAKPVVSVEIFVPGGEVLARKTLNSRLGIIGGISILGTTGIVRPMSHPSYESTIISALSVAQATGCRHVVLTTGRRSERFAQTILPDLPEIAFVQIGDFFQTSLEAAYRQAFETITLAVLFGKAVKMAQGVPHTHVARSSLSLLALSRWAVEAEADSNFAARLIQAHTAREALLMIVSDYPSLTADVGRRMLQSARHFAQLPSGNDFCGSLQGLIFDYTGKVLYDSR